MNIIITLLFIEMTAAAKSSMYAYRAPLPDKIDHRCYEAEAVRAWVYFTDKGITVDKYEDALRAVTETMDRAVLIRRQQRGGVIDIADIPLYDHYLDEVKAQGGLLLQTSKWLNAASFWIARQDLERIAEFDFVQKIVKVATFESPYDYEAEIMHDTTLYGYSYKQLRMFNIDSLHERGIFGSDIKVGILDTGLRRRHVALTDLNIIAEHDFLEGDQLYLDGIPVIDRAGTFSDMIFQNKTDGAYLFLVGDSTKFNVYPVRDVLFTRSSDGGSTWQSLRRITDHYGNWATELASCGQDTTFLFYRDRYGLQYIIFTDTLIDEGTAAPLGHREPSAQRFNDTVHVTYHDKHKLYYARGTTSGFPSAFMVDSSTSWLKAPSIVVNPNYIGIFYNTYPDDSLYYTIAAQGDSVFTITFRAIGEHAQPLSRGDTIYVVWKAVSQSHLFDIVFSYSTDFGMTFSAPQNLASGLAAVGKISMTKQQSRIEVWWESGGRIYSQTSYDNGLSFGIVDSLTGEFYYLPTIGSTGTDILPFYFQRGDSITDGYTADQKDYWHPRHGTEMLSIIGGYSRNNYVGIAPAAQFLIAKTENPDTSPSYEFPVEEDTWIAGLEWMEARGADIVNSSLGYSDWYAWPDDFDGKTAPASVAAEQAARRGMIIVNSAGNYSVPRIGVPGDADRVITVGGVDTLYNRWQYSGYFPTSDHAAKKPEIMALSNAPIVVNPDTTNSYLYSRGTSGAAAMITGICALLLDGHPQWNIDSLRTALFATAVPERYVNRDTVIDGEPVTVVDTIITGPADSTGYGWVDALAAFDYAPYDLIPPGIAFLTVYPNPFILTEHAVVHVPFKLDASYLVEFRIYSISGKVVLKEQREGMLLPGCYTSQNQNDQNAAFIWDGIDEGGQAVASGLYYCVLTTHGGGSAVTKIAVIR